MVSLWIYNGGELVDNLQVFAKVLEGCIIKLLVIISDDYLRQAKSIDN